MGRQILIETNRQQTFILDNFCRKYFHLNWINFPFQLKEVGVGGGGGVSAMSSPNFCVNLLRIAIITSLIMYESLRHLENGRRVKIYELIKGSRKKKFIHL